MGASEYIAAAGLLLTVLSIFAYLVSENAKIKSDIVHILKDIEEFHGMKDKIYQIHALLQIMYQKDIPNQR